MIPSNKEFQNVLKRMPLVQEIIIEYQDEKPLRGYSVLFLQHQFPAQYGQVQALLELGVLKEDLYWIDIPYTSNPYVVKALIDMGIPRENLISSQYQLDMKYRTYQRTRVQKWISQNLDKISSKDQKLLVFDDGSYFIEAYSCFKKRDLDIRIIEQTARGIIKFRKNAAIRFSSIRCPIINIAESEPKKKIEPSFITEDIIEAFQRKRDLLRDKINFKKDDKVLILGYGAIGASVADMINNNIQPDSKSIFVHDPSPEKMNSIKQNGYSLWESTDFRTRFKIVIGCSGQTSFNMWDHVFLDESAVLFSTSSGASELSREELIELANSSDDDDIKVIFKKEIRDFSKIHNNIEIEFPYSRALILNGGFPINFDGINLKGVSPEKIQYTIASMIRGAIQASQLDKESKEYRGGLIDFSTDHSERIMKYFSIEICK